jgi:hypothetical protein
MLLIQYSHFWQININILGGFHLLLWKTNEDENCLISQSRSQIQELSYWLKNGRKIFLVHMFHETRNAFIRNITVATGCSWENFPVE